MKRPKPKILDAGERAYFHVGVEEIAKRECPYCATLWGRSVKATHEVYVVGWVSFTAPAGRLALCEDHAKEAAESLRAALATKSELAARSGKEPTRG